MPRSSPYCAALASGLALGALFAADAAPTTAQDDDATVAGPTAQIGAGGCEEPTESLYELAPFEAGFLKRDRSTSERVGPASAVGMLSSSTELEVAAGDLWAEPHAIVVLDSEQRPIACGEMGGYFADDSLVVGLRMLEGAGLAGFATIWDDQDVAAVELHLAEGLLAPGGSGDDADDRSTTAAGAADVDDADDGAAGSDDAGETDDDADDGGAEGTDDDDAGTDG